MLPAQALDFRPPGGENYALIGSSGSVLPGGRFLLPLGAQLPTGPGPNGLAVSRNGTIATADTGPERFGVTVIEAPGKSGWKERHIWARTPNSTAPEIADPAWKSVGPGIAFDESGKNIWVSEGPSGRLRLIDWNTGDTRKVASLNTAELGSSFTGALVPDNARHLLYVLDSGNARVAVFDTKTNRVVSSIPVDHPAAIALAPNGDTLYVSGSDSLCAFDLRDVSNPSRSAEAKLHSQGELHANADHIFLSDAVEDSVAIMDAKTLATIAEVPLRITGFEQYRGIKPSGMAYDPVTKWLLVAESAINAVGIVDTQTNRLIAHLPAGWQPSQVAIRGDRVYVTNALGRGTGPNNRHAILDFGEVPTLYHGSVTTFIMPGGSELGTLTQTVYVNNGFVPWKNDRPHLPEAIKHVVLIEKEGHSFDEVMGDVTAAGDRPVLGFPRLARFGMHGYADGGKKRFSVQDAPITPNQHRIAERWAFSDNFYAGEAQPADPWLSIETDPNIFRKVAVRTTEAAATGIGSLKDAGELPQFLDIHLRDDATASWPYEASQVEESDLAVGRILDGLSHSRWWPEMIVFIADTNTGDGLDHVDSHRTLLFAAGPWIRQDYVSHTNADFGALRRAIFELLHLPPMTLTDATAAHLSDMFTEKPDFAPYDTLKPDGRILQ